MSYKWDDQLIKRFLTLYRKHKCLWNPYSPNYRNCSAKNDAFKIVIRELNIPQIGISDCLQQIEIIREKYKQEQLKAEKELKSGKLYTSKVPWFNLMSQMLCEVVNDEENFSDDPVTFVPCIVTTDKSHDGNKKSSDFLYNPEKYVGGKSKHENSNACITSLEELEAVNSGAGNLPEKKSLDNNLQHELKTVNDASSSWNACPYCGWEKEKDLNRAREFDNQRQKEVQIYPEIEVPLGIKETKILDKTNNVSALNQVKYPPPCFYNTNYSNCKVKIPGRDILQDKKEIQMNANARPPQDDRGEYDSLQQQKCNVMKENVPYQDNSKATKRVEVESLKGPNAHSPRRNNELERNLVMCSNRTDDIDQNQLSKNHLQGFEIDENNRENLSRKLQKLPEFDDEMDRNKNMIVKRCGNSCMQRFEESGPRLASTCASADVYEVCSRFKIIIPSSDDDRENLEITGYEVRMINPELSKYRQDPNFETPEAAVRDFECLCKNAEVPLSRKKVTGPPAEHRSIIKLDISQKRSKKTRAKDNRVRTSGTSYVSKENEFQKELKSSSNKATQTDTYRENESMQTTRNMETSRLYSPDLSRKGGRATNITPMNGTSHQVTTTNGDQNLITQRQSMLEDDSAISQNPSCCPKPSQIDNISTSAGNFNHTRTVLDVILRILQSQDSHDKTEDLQTTLDTMLDRFQQMSMTVQSAPAQQTYTSRNATYNSQIESDISENSTYDSLNLMHNSRDTTYPSRNATFNSENPSYNDTSLDSTRYGSIAPDLENRRASTTNLRRATNGPLELGDRATDFAPRGVEIVDETTNSERQSPLRGGRNDVAIAQASGSERRAGSLNERNESIDERSTRTGPNVSRANDMNAPNFTANSLLDYTNDFSNEEPVASSSRRIREHRSPSQLMKDFLDVIKCTMMMDGISQATENGNNDCCAEPTDL